MQALVEAAGMIGGASVELRNDPKRKTIPAVHVRLDEDVVGKTALEVVRELQDGDPGIAANPSYVREGVVAFGPMCLKEGEAQVVGRRLRVVLGA
jgi:hypothetical protein